MDWAESDRRCWESEHVIRLEYGRGPNNRAGTNYEVTIGNAPAMDAVTLDQRAAVESLMLEGAATLQTDNVWPTRSWSRVR